MAAYWAVCNLKAKNKDSDKNTIHAAILHATGFTPEENALTDWLNMIIVKNWALSSVECKFHRNMCKHKHTFSVKRICMMTFILGEVVETKITKMLVNAKAVGLYDGFTGVLPKSISYIYKVFQHLGKLWMGIWHHP
jgi:hypothetical protein